MKSPKKEVQRDFWEKFMLFEYFEYFDFFIEIQKKQKIEKKVLANIFLNISKLKNNIYISISYSFYFFFEFSEFQIQKK